MLKKEYNSNESTAHEMMEAVGKTNYLRTCGMFPLDVTRPVVSPVIEKGTIISRKGSIGRANFQYKKPEKA